MTVQYGDLPHKIRVPGGNVLWLFEKFKGLSDFSAHTHANQHNMPCHRCDRCVSLVATKPGSPYVWCLKCF